MASRPAVDLGARVARSTLAKEVSSSESYP
jgi:hypothetical protein